MKRPKLLVVPLLLASLLQAGPAQLIVAVGPELPADRREEIAGRTGDLLFRCEPGTRITVLDAGHLNTVVDAVVPAGSLRLRQQKLTPQIIAAVRMVRAATNGNAQFNLPRVLDHIGRQMHATNASVLLVGPALYRHPLEPAFDMTTHWPSDGHLSAGSTRSVFSTVERAHLLDGLDLHWLVTDADAAANEPHRDGVERFWTLFVATQDGVLAACSPDVANVFASALAGRTAPHRSDTLDSRDTNVVMRSRRLEVAREADLVRALVTLTNVVRTTNVITVTNVLKQEPLLPRVASGNTGIGIVWTTVPSHSRFVDLDLYVRVPRDGSELCYSHTVSPYGRYFRDIRQSLPQSTADWKAAWEFVELQGEQLPPEIWLNLYSGSGPVPGEVRVQWQGREQVYPFVFPAVSGNHGRNRDARASDQHWLRIDLSALPPR